MTQSPPPAPQSLLDIAVEMAENAGKITLQWFGKPDVGLEFKGDGTPVTAADKAAERVIREQIEKYAPGSRVVGEEEGTAEGTSELTWFVDPIDGTKGFARGVPLYATLIAVDDGYGPAVGVIHIPATGETVWAGRGLGCHTHAGQARVSTTSEVEGAYVTTSSVVRWGPDVFFRASEKRLEVRGWGDGYGFLMVATGRVDAMVDLHGGNVWDFAPMPVILAEAGGRFSALDGTCCTDTSSGIASNGLLHDQILEIVSGSVPEAE